VGAPDFVTTAMLDTGSTYSVLDADVADRLGAFDEDGEEDIANSSKMAGWTGLEPATSDVTGRRSNQLNYHPARVGTTNSACGREPESRDRSFVVGGTGFEPVTPGV
jgi:hypothetical protein